MILRTYQSAVVADVLPRLAAGRRVVVVLPTGSGKTVVASEIVRRFGRPTLWLAHRRELIAQARESLPSGVVVDSVQRRKPFPPTSLVVIDECFVAGTMVGDKPIESVRPGHFVPAIDTRGRGWTYALVHSVSRREAPDRLVSVSVAGRTIVCTEDHPFLTDEGWLPAALVGDRMVATITDELHRMRDAYRESNKVATVDIRSRRSRLLQCGMRESLQGAKLVGDDGANESEVRIGSHDRAEPDEEPDDSREGPNDASRDRLVTSSPWREWSRPDGSATRARGGSRVAHGTRHSDQGAARDANLPDLLQGRHRELYVEDRDRSRRVFARLARRSRQGCEEGGLLGIARVDRVEVHERGSDGTFGGLCPDGFVYNLHVEGSNTYAANGVIVHNCHHSVAGSYLRHLANHRGAVLHLTATPYRLDGRGIGEVADEAVWVDWPADAMPRVMSGREGDLTMTGALVREGVLVEPRYFSIPGMSLDGVKTARGDYETRGLVVAADKPSVLGDAVREYRAHAAGRRAVAFCVTVEHARHVAETFNAAGVRAAVVTGDTPKQERDGTLAALRAGTVSVVATVMVLTEGWDLPALEALICLRPTQSRCLWLQMLGRVMRVADGKSGAVVLDHAGNIVKHGFATDPVYFNLDGRTLAGKGVPTLATCKECYAMFPSGPTECPECGAEMRQESVPKDVQLGFGDDTRLVEMTPAERQHAAHSPAAWDEAVRTTPTIGAAKWRYKQLVGEWPLVSVEGKILDPLSEEGRKRAYFELLEVATAKGHKIGSAAYRYSARYGQMPPYQWLEKYKAWALRKGAAVNG